MQTRKCTVCRGHRIEHDKLFTIWLDSNRTLLVLSPLSQTAWFVQVEIELEWKETWKTNYPRILVTQLKVSPCYDGSYRIKQLVNFLKHVQMGLISRIGSKFSLIDLFLSQAIFHLRWQVFSHDAISSNSGLFSVQMCFFKSSLAEILRDSYKKYVILYSEISHLSHCLNSANFL